MLDEEMFKQPLDKDYKEDKYQSATSRFIESQLSQNTISFRRGTQESIEKGFDEWKQEYLDSLSKNTDHNKIMFGKNTRPSHQTRRVASAFKFTFSPMQPTSLNNSALDK